MKQPACKKDSGYILYFGKVKIIREVTDVLHNAIVRFFIIQKLNSSVQLNF